MMDELLNALELEEPDFPPWLIPDEVCMEPEQIRRRTLYNAAVEGWRLRKMWTSRLEMGKLKSMSVTAYALARPEADIGSLEQLLHLSAAELAELYADPDPVDRLEETLRSQDLTIVTRGLTSISFETTVGQLQQITDTPLALGVWPVIATPFGIVLQPYLRFPYPVVDLPPGLLPQTLAIDIETPVTMALSSPPTVNYLHLTLENELRRCVNCTALTSAYQGADVPVSIIDSGVALEHEYFNRYPNQIDVHLIPDARFEQRDPWGHGTAMVAAMLAIAPGVDLTVTKIPMTRPDPALRRYATDAIIETMQQIPTPKIVVCAWGIPQNGSNPPPPRLKMEIATLSQQHDTLFVCAAGNGQHYHPANLQEVIAVGGAYRNAHNELVASNYTSSFVSTEQGHKHCPEIAGPSGPDPLGVYVMVPTDEVSYYDVLLHGDGSRYPNGDQTDPGDGWCGMGGSSIAAAVVAGVSAVVRGAYSGLTVDEVKEVLLRTADDIIFGRSADRHYPKAAGSQASGPYAGGEGMVNAFRAVQEALKRKFKAATMTGSVQVMVGGGPNLTSPILPEEKWAVRVNLEDFRPENREDDGVWWIGVALERSGREPLDHVLRVSRTVHSRELQPLPPSHERQRENVLSRVQIDPAPRSEKYTPIDIPIRAIDPGSYMYSLTIEYYRPPSGNQLLLERLLNEPLFIEGMTRDDLVEMEWTCQETVMVSKRIEIFN